LLSKNIKIKIYRNIILPVVVYRCETWSLTFREERRLRMFENRVLRRIFGPKREEVNWGVEKLRYVELNYLYSSPKFGGHKIGNNKMGGGCSAYGGEERRIPSFGGETRVKETTRTTQTYMRG